jgi:glutamyl-tRNA reductase
MVVGEDQILGQVRSAVKLAAEHGTAGRVLGELGRLALRTGKRARAETAIGRAGLSLLSAAVELAAARLGPLRPDPAGPRPDEPSPDQQSPDQQSPDDRRDPLAGRDVLVVGAGSMSGLATATAARSGAASITVANRTRKHAERLAASVSTVTTTVTGLADLPAAIAAADVVISCTGAAGQVITGDMVSAALAARTAQQAKVAKQAEVAKQAKVAKVAKEATATTAARGTWVIMDLAMPRDVEAAVADLPGVVLIGMDQLSEHAGAVRDDDVAAVRTILEAELAAYQSAMDAARVAPTVVALRAKAAGVVDAELARLAGRLSADDLSGHALDEIAQTVRRVVDKLLHAPTVRVKELAGSPGGEEYAAALRVLFDLDPRAVEAVTRAAPEQEGSR